MKVIDKTGRLKTTGDVGPQGPAGAVGPVGPVGPTGSEGSFAQAPFRTDASTDVTIATSDCLVECALATTITLPDFADMPARMTLWLALSYNVREVFIQTNAEGTLLDLTVTSASSDYPAALVLAWNGAGWTQMLRIELRET